jgi:iron(III) transport system permease protein
MHGNRRFFSGLAIVLGVLAVLPVAAIVGRGLGLGGGETWAHLAATVYAEIRRQYAGAGRSRRRRCRDRRHGGRVGWSHAAAFPGSRFFAWALLLPLAMPSYVMAYAYTDFLQYAGPVQTALREAFGWTYGDYWFPEVRSLPGAARCSCSRSTRTCSCSRGRRSSNDRPR